MINMTVKGLPQLVYRRLKQSARLEGRSLNAQVIQILREHVADEQRIRSMRESQEELERFVAALPPMSDSTPLIREDRNREN
ncbi:MAG: Arc family DNA-binding protein [Acidobacteriia bacterium]|nr:Arc family DNA-binding protein [Terriglobia bacterium]